MGLDSRTRHVQRQLARPRKERARKLRFRARGRGMRRAVPAPTASASVQARYSSRHILRLIFRSNPSFWDFGPGRRAVRHSRSKLLVPHAAAPTCGSRTPPTWQMSEPGVHWHLDLAPYGSVAVEPWVFHVMRVSTV